MQAIILAAGMGKRLGEFTRNNTKCMVPVNGVPMIDRLLKQLCKLSLKRVIIVIGYEGQKLVDYVNEHFSDKLCIEFINNPIYYKTNNIYSLSLTQEKMQEDDTLLIESDLLLDDRMFPLILNNPHPNLALVAKYQTWMDGTMVKIDEDNNIINFVPKKAFKYSDVDQYYKTVNVYKFSRDFSIHKYVPFLNAYSEALGNNEYYEQVLRVICFLDKSDLKALPINDEKWYESDDKADLDISEALFAQGDERLKKYMKRFGGYWRFPNMLDYCYLVNPYFPSPKLLDEMRANFDILLTEYPSGMYVNTLLASKCFGVKEPYVLPGNGAAELIKSLMENIDGKLGVIYPTFEEYPNRRIQQSLVKYTPGKEDFRYNADDLIDFFGNNPVENLLIINPDNPSGNYLSKNEIIKLADWCKSKDIRLIVDISFIDFSENYEEDSLLHDDILETYPKMVVMKSISKSYGVPGLRLGIMASADTELISWMKKDVSIWNINSFAEFFMQIYSKYEKDYKSACIKFQQEREMFKAELDSIPFLRVIPSQANYFLCEVTERFSSHELAVKLLEEHNILIKDCSTKKVFNGRNYIRLAVRRREDNMRLIKSLRSLVL
ncbi:MAG: aminotransferase class I/II-fold pyridoxal phosphate-dependent enzyme [Paludibacteraceae bacterium]|nr:aminotransferase class I/II-fold pyridoxal phosphate-dependent enzyme [Candidatus Physcocola equi]MCQ2233993.1 aminotransferase class I/II-fold pyridoxal phosphate-dependent enzyme [Paludibacteraceae bacterium]